MRRGSLFFPRKTRQDETLPLEEAERRYFLEFVIVVAIICGLLTMYLREFTAGIERAKLVEAFMLFQAPRLEAMVHHAVTGTWLESGSVSNNSGKYVLSVGLSDGVVLANVCLSENVRDQVLSFVPATTTGSPSVVVWLCGEAEPPPGFVRLAASRTSGLESVLPHTCRPRRFDDE